MNGVLWLQQTVSGLLGKRAGEEKPFTLSAPPGMQYSSSVFVSHPQQTRFTTSASTTAVFVQAPLTVNKQSSKGFSPFHWVRSALPGTIAAMAAGASLFALIGILHLMVATPQIRTAFAHSMISPSQRVLPKSSPHQNDGISNEYQHAITTDWIDARDTAGFVAATGNRAKDMKAMRKRMVTVTPSSKRVSDKLQFMVHNGSQHTLERVRMEVELLQKNGRLIRTDTFAVHRVAPGKDKAFKLPKALPGKRFQYRIIEVKSHSYTTTLQHI